MTIPTLAPARFQTAFWDEFNWADIAQKAILAVVILAVTWIVAKLVTRAFAALVGRVPALQRSSADGSSIGQSLGQIVSLLVWMFGLIAVLQLFQLDQALAPVQNLLNGVTSFLPKLIGAGVVFVIGALLAKVVRELIETALSALPIDRWLGRARGAQNQVTAEATGHREQQQAYNNPAEGGQIGQQYAQQTGQAPAQQGGPGAGGAGSVGQRIAKTLATIAYALIMIVVSIAALQILGIQSISRPAERMLTTIFDAIPVILAALLLLALGGLIAKFAADILGQILEGVGTDRVLRDADLLPEGKSATPIITKIVQVAIVLFFAVMAAQTLNFPQITRFLSEVLELGGRVVFGAAIIAAGVFIANLLAKLIGGEGATPLVIRVATIVLFSAMGLKYMGIADSIIELAFGALVVGGAAAAALAFGLGGRDAAARQLEELRQRKGENQNN
ncbi:putative transporter (transmembrane protein) [Barrientosiimonas humi]|uniref:Putative transporter (Transmembrane protein) n=1 Tax=Barrientosiimonas humi TaxID=999931 RepID=A0A542XGB2_9MICO|nr:mechanosensitive ion channel [Barrientosiimonas humi]TQL34864.1 putative transporter (transmembrane protein) [Barrientosiimonas humi]CAG7571039.1 hypothetical protein BH39T_PBIAJDOK_00165 [Barrientosiimonas humi]